MSGLDALHITVPQTDHYHPYNHRNSHSSMSSHGSSSNGSSPNDVNWDGRDMDDSHKRSTKRGVSTFISKLFR